MLRACKIGSCAILMSAISSVAAFFIASGQTLEKPKVETLVYDVVTIKLPRPDWRVGVQLQRGKLHGCHVTAKQLIANAYGIQESQISEEPAWTETERFDIEAKMDEATAAVLEKMTAQQQKVERQRMLQEVLAERFQLKVHRGTKEIPIYALVVAKSGLKLKEADPADSVFFKLAGMSIRWGQFAISGGNPDLIFTGHGIPVSRLVEVVLNSNVDRVVADRTGLTRNYDMELKWTPQDRQGAPMEEAGGSLVPAAPGATIYMALEKQLGLKLDSIKAPMEAIVIDHVEKPSEN
jgi:uncharacterized protein (TIGR03435 family)